MSIILAALDSTGTAESVLQTALRVGEMTGSEVEAVHVTTRRGPSPELLAERAGVTLRQRTGPVGPELLRAIDDPAVLAAVIGARASRNGGRLTGATARHIAEHASKPVVLVPPEYAAPKAFHRVLLPLEGTEISSQPVIEGLLPLLGADVEIVVVHVFTEATQPRMLDHPWRDLKMLGNEFLSRHFPREVQIEMRSGPVGIRVAEVAREHGADMVILSWSQDSSPGRARILREVVDTLGLPTLLLPAGPRE